LGQQVKATDRSRKTNLFSLPPERRNRIYRAHFDGIRDPDLPRNKHNYVLATAVRPFLDVFEASRQVYDEMHGLFFAEYFPRSRYSLEDLKAMQAFADLPSNWKRRTHALEVRSQDADVGLQYLNTINAVLEFVRNSFSRLLFYRFIYSSLVPK
jgi:hypothetical protein